MDKPYLRADCFYLARIQYPGDRKMGKDRRVLLQQEEVVNVSRLHTEAHHFVTLSGQYFFRSEI